MESLEPIPKKLCTDSNSVHDKKTENYNLKKEANFDDSENLNILSDIKVKRVLNNLEEKCSIAFEGTNLRSSERAVVLLQKLPFAEENLNEIFCKLTNFRTLFKNDVYHNQVAHLPLELNEIRVNTIFPADDKHIKKFEKQPSSFIIETPSLYRTVTLPFIESLSYSKQWIYNILDHKSEVDRIICEDLDPNNGFILVPDMKWTGEQVENLYLQAIVVRRDLLSIRDLREEHLPLLRNIYSKCTKAIKEKYNIPSSKLRIYCHYQPSYYHLHIHFSALSFEAPGIWVGKSHLLQDIISNIEIDSDYYKNVNLSFAVKDNHPLKLIYEEKGYFKNN
ncbi:UNVERIFIED_CONTAM: hypothetical protein RMT77_002964 [Armadillidium vulgare]